MVFFFHQFMTNQVINRYVYYPTSTTKGFTMPGVWGELPQIPINTLVPDSLRNQSWSYRFWSGDLPGQS